MELDKFVKEKGVRYSWGEVLEVFIEKGFNLREYVEMVGKSMGFDKGEKKNFDRSDFEKIWEVVCKEVKKNNWLD